MEKFKLLGMKTQVDWQLAYEASKHVIKGKRIVLTYETPDGDVSMAVKTLNGVTHITKLKQPE